MPTLTRGGLVPAKVINDSTKEEVPCMFNPFEYTLSKSNSWEKKNVIGQNIPDITFSQGGSISLSLNLTFDTQLTDSDVREHTNKLWKMMMIDSTTEDQVSGKGSPPKVVFSWGKLNFKSVITSMTQKFVLFKEDGTPLRCQVSLTLEQVMDDNAVSPQVQGAQTTGASGGGNQTKKQGDRIDTMAASSTGSANNHRAVAENNNMDNPMKTKNGSKIKG
jgi:hypothetical protein